MAAPIFISYPTGAVGVTDPGVTECDKLASYPHDYKRVAPPVRDVYDTAQAIAACREALVKFPNHPRLQFLLGMLLDSEPRARWVKSPGLPFLKKASDQGYLAATYVKGKALLKTWGRGRRSEGRNLLFVAARKGHLQAQAELPRHVGRMNEAQRKEALEWGELAIKRGDVDAYASIASAYLLVMSDAKHYPKAIDYLHKGDRAGSLEAMALLGRLQVFPFAPNGMRNLLPENHYGGMQRMLDAARGGSKRAAFYLGLLYTGVTYSVSARREKMIYWFCRAGERGRYMVAEMLEADVSTYRCNNKKSVKQ
ncbi:MAG: hypothetical protein CMM52_01225 [Rhodospirillaceae bacterium]|nr:hypothetical protein [Rhodospirillaceae bacterium]|tara:strand:+ start:5781 stop:6710 length:930 start_codon:yes stop_codon:yes gene_type:complete